jgi:N-methylhydantoinase A
VAAKLRRRGVQTVAVCFINAYANSANEQRMREILSEELPGVTVSTSSEILPEIFEYERFSTTVANAVLSPLVGGYVKRLGERLREGGYTGDLLLLHSGGGVMTGALVQKYAVRLAASGIAAGAIACRQLALLCGHQHAIGLDMGGTSTDIALVHDGEMRTTNEWTVEYGYPICFPSIEILTIGAGGGSLAWIDQAGSLRNGPQSAGADPGPACYLRGGEEPTNTDANVVLGRLGTELVAGGMTLDRSAAEESIRRKVAEPLGMDLRDAASAVIKVANANMADAVRLISIRRGLDPREFALVAFGGAGPLHGAAVAKELSIPVVIVPPNPGITSALGCMLVDVRHDLATMYLRPAESADLAEIEQEFAKLEAEARERLRHEGVPDEHVSLQRTIAMRYLGQWRSLAVPVESGLASLQEVTAKFHDQHEREYAYRRDGAPIEIYQLGLRAIGITPNPELRRHELTGVGVTPEPFTRRPVKFDELDEPVETPIFHRDALPAGVVIHGPAIIDQFDSTTVVPPGLIARVDEYLIICLHLTEGLS